MISSALVIIFVSSELVLARLSSLIVLTTLIGSQLISGIEFVALTQSLNTNTTRILLVTLLIFNLHACYAATISMGAPNTGALMLNLGALGWVSLKFFTARGLIYIYIYFELSLVPIFLIIMGWGYQFERVRARTAIVIYTLVGSLPLLLLIIYLRFSSTRSVTMLASNFRGGRLSLLSLALIAFLVKLPMVGLHMWLPKAHVEAPVVGSMFLAAILLKLGGFGVFLFTDLITRRALGLKLVALRLVGAIYVASLCCQALDIKVIIAFSSVGHIRLVVVMYYLNLSIRMAEGRIILISHGFSSSLIFLRAYIVYKNTASRSLVLNKNINNLRGIISLLWVISVLALVGCPPSLNIWVEISAYMTLLSELSSRLKYLALLALIRGVYGFILMGKFVRGGDVLYKQNIRFTLVDLIQVLFGCVMTCVRLVFMPVLLI